MCYICECDGRTDWSIWNVTDAFTWPISNTGTDTTILMLNMVMQQLAWED